MPVILSVRCVDMLKTDTCYILRHNKVNYILFLVLYSDYIFQPSSSSIIAELGFLHLNMKVTIIEDALQKIAVGLYRIYLLVFSHSTL